MKLFVVLALGFTALLNVTGEDVQDLQYEAAFPTGRIINGYEAQKGEAPFIVSLKFGSHFCAGSIIDPHWVVTAAHCLVYSTFQVVGGLHSRNDESDVQIRRVTSKQQLIAHEKYGGGVGPYDIGLIYIAEPFNLNARTRDGRAAVGKASLPSGKYEQTGRGKLFGWGRVNSGVLPNTLQTLDADIINYSKCKAALPAGDPVEPSNICSYTAGKADGSCNGDSGGPLVRYTKGGPELVGIVSWGYTPCASTKFPSVYTRTSAYKQWIKKKIRNYRP